MRVRRAVGVRFDRLTLLKRLENGKSRQNRWLAKCDCGKETIVFGTNLSRGHTTSCGCYSAKVHRKHGDGTVGRRPPEYNIWSGMVQRCTNPRSPAWKFYGGRGITICNEWRQSYLQFLTDMGRKPTGDSEIDRIDNNKGYSKENCRWSNREQQMTNMRNNRWITYEGETHLLTHWARLKGIHPSTLNSRITLWKWPLHRAFNEPIRKRK